MSATHGQPRHVGFLLRDLPWSIGLALLIVSPPFLERVYGSRAYYSFDILRSFLIPHLEGLAVLWLLLHVLFVIFRHWNLVSKSVTVPVAALLLLFVFRGVFTTAGISPFQLSHTVHDLLALIGFERFDPTLIKNVGAFILFVACFWVLSRNVDGTSPIFRACAAFGWVLGLITLYRCVPLIAAEAELSRVHDRAATQEPVTSHLPGRRVVWLIFDEFDYDRFFVRRAEKLELPNIDRLVRESVSADNAVSPARDTALSIPALTTGTYFTNNRVSSNGTMLLEVDHRQEVEWGETSSIFSRLHSQGLKVSILGFYHNYCKTFPYADPCLNLPGSAYAGWWWGTWQALKIVPGLDKLFLRGHLLNGEGMNQVTRLQIDALARHLNDSAKALSFIHLNIPHLPGGRVHGVPYSPFVAQLPRYDQNALTVDWVVGKVVENLEKHSQSQDILLVVSSDHWVRMGLHAADLPADQFEREFGHDTTEVHRIPFFARRIREGSPYSIPQPINTVHTTHLIEDFIAGKVADHAGIVEWWKDKPFYPPMITGEDNQK